jgi:hypothetical protein
MVDRNRSNRSADGACGDKGQRESLSGDGSDGTFVMHDLTPGLKGFADVDNDGGTDLGLA